MCGLGNLLPHTERTRPSGTPDRSTECLAWGSRQQTGNFRPMSRHTVRTMTTTHSSPCTTSLKGSMCLHRKPVLRTGRTWPSRMLMHRWAAKVPGLVPALESHLVLGSVPGSALGSVLGSALGSALAKVPGLVELVSRLVLLWALELVPGWVPRWAWVLEMGRSCLDRRGSSRQGTSQERSAARPASMSQRAARQTSYSPRW